MRNIVVIDDKDHALKQVIYEFPGTNKNDLSFRHFDSIASFRKAGLEDLLIVFLDFFLSKDRDYGTSLIPELKCEHLICFSSMKQASDRMLGAAIEMGPERIRHTYSVQKLKDGLPNEELRSAGWHFREKRIALPYDCGSIESLFLFDPVRGE